MNLESYTGSRLGTSDSDDAVDAETEARLRRTLARAIETGEVILADHPDDVEALYALGVAHGTLASFEATVRRAYFKANGEAKKARDYHMQVLAIRSILQRRPADDRHLRLRPGRDPGVRPFSAGIHRHTGW